MQTVTRTRSSRRWRRTTARHGEHKQKAGHCHLTPPGFSHTVIGWSEEVELLELTAPGHDKTTGTVNGVEVVPATAQPLSRTALEPGYFGPNTSMATRPAFSSVR